MAQLLKVHGIGHLGGDPEMRYTPDGLEVTSFSVAVGHSRKDKQSGEWVDSGTDWFRLSAFGNFAVSLAERLRKGTKVYFEGDFSTREFEGRDGETRTSLDVKADKVIVLKNGANEDDEARFGGSTTAAPAPRPAAPNDFDDLPF